MADAATPPPSPQRKYQALCPGCGAPVRFLSAQSSHAVCGFCRSTVVRDGAVLARVGEMAELFADHSILQMGTTGVHDGQTFTLIGGLQYRYDEGLWTEWQALLADGRTAWLSEDNGGQVWSEESEAPAGTSLAEAKWQLGQRFDWQGVTYQVSAIQQASLLSAQGELPRLPPVGQPFKLVELRSVGQLMGVAQVLSIDYGALLCGRAEPDVTVGRAVTLPSLQLKNTRSANAKDEQARVFDCPNCGSAVTLQQSSSQSVTCPSCHSVIDVSKGIGGELQHAQQREADAVPPKIALGTEGEWAGQRWQVVGYQVRKGCTDDDDTFLWREYLLYSAQGGFAFLVDSSDGWSFVRPVTGAAQVRGESARLDGVNYRLDSQYRAEALYVEGEFYWQVKSGQVTQNSDYVSGQKLLSSETSDNECVWSQGEQVSLLALSQAFGFRDAPSVRNGAPVKPFSAAPQVSVISIVFWVIVALIVLSAVTRCGAPLMSESSSSQSWDDSTQSSDSPSRSSGGSYGGYTSGGGHK